MYCNEKTKKVELYLYYKEVAILVITRLNPNSDSTGFHVQEKPQYVIGVQPAQMTNSFLPPADSMMPPHQMVCS